MVYPLPLYKYAHIQDHKVLTISVFFVKGLREGHEPVPYFSFVA